MTRFDTAFFDLDGTLTDSAPGILNSIRHALKQAGAPEPSPEILNLFIGPPLVDSFKRYCGFTPQQANQALADYRTYFTTMGGMLENRVYDGVEELLTHLNALGVRCLVATSKPEVFSNRILQHFALAHHFAAVHGATLDESRNRKADIIAWALTHSGELGRVVMIGDRDHDVNGAHVNHLPAIGVTYGYGSRAELMQAHAEFLADTPADIERIIANED